MIKVVNIYKSFKDRLILNNINFEVNKGETLVIIGGSGSGKSTLLKLLIGCYDLSKDKFSLMAKKYQN